jgi:hypothetical protein
MALFLASTIRFRVSSSSMIFYNICRQYSIEKKKYSYQYTRGKIIPIIEQLILEIHVLFKRKRKRKILRHSENPFDHHKVVKNTKKSSGVLNFFLNQ